MHRTQLTLETHGRACIEITNRLQDLVTLSELTDGLCHIFLQHTSASLIVCENADTDVLVDLESFLKDLIPDGDTRFIHTAEGPDDMPAHVRSIITQIELTLPVNQGRLQLGTWQGIYLYEHRHRPHQRHIIVSLW